MTSYPGYGTSVWQAMSGMAFTNPQGPVFTPGPGGWQWETNLGALGAEIRQVGDAGGPVPATLSTATRDTYLGELRTLGVRSVVVGPERYQAQVAPLYTELLGSPADAVGGVVVWYQVNPAALLDG